MSERIHIVGGGLVGLACGLRLLRSGRAVTLLDAGRAGRGASWAAAGMLAPRFEADFDDVEMIRLLVESQRRWADYADSLHADGRAAVDYDDTGTLFVALDRDDEEAARRWYDFARHYQLPVDRLDRDALLDREPLLSARARMAVVCAGDHQVDNRKLVELLRTTFLALGGELREESAVASIEVAAGAVRSLTLASGDSIATTNLLLASGAWTRTIDGLAPHRPVIRPVKGQALALRPRPGEELPRAVLRSTEVYLAPKRDRLIVGGTMEEMGFDARVTSEAVCELLRAAYELVPSTYELELAETWAGFRPASTSGRPILGPSAVAGLTFALGHHRHGVLLLPITVDTVTAHLLGRPLPEVARPFLATHATP
jgi:glycine oxidase